MVRWSRDWRRRSGRVPPGSTSRRCWRSAARSGRAGRSTTCTSIVRRTTRCRRPTSPRTRAVTRRRSRRSATPWSRAATPTPGSITTPRSATVSPTTPVPTCTTGSARSTQPPGSTTATSCRACVRHTPRERGNCTPTSTDACGSAATSSVGPSSTVNDSTWRDSPSSARVTRSRHRFLLHPSRSPRVASDSRGCRRPTIAPARSATRSSATTAS